MKRRELEKPIMDAILDSAHTLGVACWRRNVGAAKLKGFFIRFSSPGQSDLWGWDANGVHFELEVKRPGGKPTKEQKDWLAYCTEHGCHTGLVDSVNDGVDFLNDMKIASPTQWRRNWEE